MSLKAKRRIKTRLDEDFEEKVIAALDPPSEVEAPPPSLCHLSPPPHPVT
jgi:hypothetical protein